MNTLGFIKIGWRQLQDILNVVRLAVNERTPIQGEGIELKSTPGGTMISVQKKAKDEKGGDDVSDGHWMNIDVMDASCHRSTIKVWVKGSS